MYSVKEASSKMGISDSHCRRLLERRQIKGKKLGHDWVVLSLDYERRRKPKKEVAEVTNKTSPRQLAKQLGVSASHLSRVKNGNTVALNQMTEHIYELTVYDKDGRLIKSTILTELERDRIPRRRNEK